MSGSSLHQVLHEYAVPLQVWIGPAARSIAADPLMDTLGSQTVVHTNPLSSIDVRGPAVLVLAAEDITGSNREALLALARKAHPGRTVLLGGTSDRDILMDAINTWAVFRVVSSDASAADLVDAVRAAGEYLRREVALSSAIDDLDIETTMLDSAIVQLEGHKDGTHDAERHATLTTVSEGLARTFAREQEALEGLTHAADDAELERVLRGVRSVTQLMEQIHDRSAEHAAGIDQHPEALDTLVEQARTLCISDTGADLDGHLGSGIHTHVDPYALTHLIVHLVRCVPQPTGIDTHLEGHRPIIQIRYAGAAVSEVVDLSQADGALAISWSLLDADGVTCDSITDANGASLIRIRLPASEAP